MKKEKHPEDVLKLIFHKEISEDGGYDILLEKAVNINRIPKNPDEIIPEILMNRIEWSATNSSCSLKNIADWRYNGWPQTCTRCKRRIIKEKFGFRCEKINGKEELVHIDCSESYLKSIGYPDDAIVLLKYPHKK